MNKVGGFIIYANKAIGRMEIVLLPYKINQEKSDTPMKWTWGKMLEYTVPMAFIFENGWGAYINSIETDLN